ncbi:MAG: Wzz/FepE/Etk N-terminal domain-containing protein [Anaerolineae bacterium]
MELTHHYFNIVRRWMWLLMLAILVASATSYWVIKEQPPVYQAEARLIVGPGVDSLSPDLNALRTGGQLMQTYAELATTRPVLQAVIDDLDLGMSPDTLDENIKVRSDNETQILSIQARDGDPGRAAAIANAVAERLVRLSPAGIGGAETQLKSQMRSEAVKLQEIITSTEARIKQLEADLSATITEETQPLISSQVPQTITAGTESRIKQLEADVQAATDMEGQHQVSSQVLQQQIASTEAEIKQLEGDLRNTTDVEMQRQLLDQIARERSHLADVLRTDVGRQHLFLDQLLKDITASTRARIEQLEADLETAIDMETQSLIGNQIEQERSRLSDVQRTNLRRQRLILDQSLQQSANITEARIGQLEADLKVTLDEGTRRLILVQIAQERSHLSDVQRTDVDKQHQIIDQTLQMIVASTEATIQQLATNFEAATNVETQRLILDEIAQERNRLSDAHQSLALLYASLQDSSINQLNIVEPATTGTPVASQLRLRVLMAGMAGLILALAIALAFEYFDDSVKTADDLARVTGVPVLGTIAKHKALHGVGRSRLAVRALPGSRATQDYHMLGSRVVFSNGDRPLHSVLLSSSQVGDDPSEIAANLAVTLAQTGTQVVLVDANLHRPTIDRLFGLADGRGPSTESRPEVPVEELGTGLTEALMERCEQPQLVSIDWAPGLSILPAGSVTPNPFELLASPTMVNLIEQLERQADIVIIAASPNVSFADSLILASHVDGVLLVARSGKTRREAVAGAVDHLRSLNAHVIGTVLSNHHGGLRSVPRRTTVPAPAESVQPA